MYIPNRNRHLKKIEIKGRLGEKPAKRSRNRVAPRTMSTPVKTPLTTAEKYTNICAISAEQRTEAYARAMEILHECASGTPEWEPVCEPLPLPKQIVLRLCDQVAMPPIDLKIPQHAQDIVQLYHEPAEQYKSAS
jgi:hypothetical protein